MRIALPVLALAIFSESAATKAHAETEQQQQAWFLGLVKGYQGKAFCIPPATTFNMVSRSFSDYALAHNMTFGGDAGAISILERIYPCASYTAWQLANTPVARLKFSPGSKIEIHADGTSTAAAPVSSPDTLIQLDAKSGPDQDAMVDELATSSDRQPPPVLLVMARNYMERGRTEDALFWLHAGQLRAQYDAARCIDPRAEVLVSTLKTGLPPQLIQAESTDPNRLRLAVDKALKWDAATPRNYDQQWFCTKGVQTPDKKSTVDLFVPERNWPAISTRVRTEYRADWEKVAASRIAPPQQPAGATTSMQTQSKPRTIVVDGVVYTTGG